MTIFKTIQYPPLLLATAMFLFAACAPMNACFFSNTERETIDLGGYTFTHLQVETGAGDIRVIASDQLSIDATHHFTGNEAQPVDIEQDGDTLIIGTTCSSDNGVCSSDFDIYVPVTTTMELESGAGDILIENMESDLIAVADSGEIQVVGFVGNVDLDQGTGAINLADVSGDVTLICDTGSITASNLDSPNFIADLDTGKAVVQLDTAPQLVSMTSGTGGVDLTLPVDDYDLQLTTDSGGMTVVNLDDNDLATRVIEIQTGTGGISVTGIEPYE